MATATKEPANGTVAQELPAIVPDLATFQQELDALLQKYSLQLVPYIITFNNGAQMADAKFVPVQK